MTNQILSGLRVVEGAAFVAAPLCGMTLGQLGAEVIRFDPLEGGLDAHRWPVTAEGKSLYWAGLNKGKRSLAVDIRRHEGRRIVSELISAAGDGAGIFVTNFPATGWMSYDTLRAQRPDLIMLQITGNPDGSTALDYTVNCAVGFPFVTGPPHGSAAVNPVNHVLPAWDAITGITAALGIVAAERHRRMTGVGQFIRLSLADVAFAMVGNLGYIAEVQVNDHDRTSTANYLYGAYGRDFQTADGRYVYVVAITPRQWQALGEVTGTTEKMAMVEQLLHVDLTREGDRFRARDMISAVLEPWFQQRTLAEIRERFQDTAVCWGPYQTFRQMVQEDSRCSTANPLFAQVDQPGIGQYLVPGCPLQFSQSPRQMPNRAPLLGEDTDAILSEILGMSDQEIHTLRDRKVVGGPIQLS